MYTNPTKPLLADLSYRGSWAFLIGSYLQLYESLEKHPVEEVSSLEEFETTK